MFYIFILKDFSSLSSRTSLFVIDPHTRVALPDSDLSCCHLLSELCMCDPLISPSVFICRCKPRLAAYRCRSRTASPQSFAKCGPESGNGRLSTPMLLPQTVTKSKRSIIKYYLQYVLFCI